jgi:hypothetical protein
MSAESWQGNAFMAQPLAGARSDKPVKLVRIQPPSALA